MPLKRKPFPVEVEHEDEWSHKESGFSSRWLLALPKEFEETNP